ncbi:OmpW/AlkL family protein [Microbulbifer magnicolonia]|uniref:OmpW/AlkL family protein n=1 Tax=Microbulbifer magnicolonia TaxID=3109744 RepID=UPI002B402BEE|nr:OmpW family outer membrane protein [Microbulbifer sp. GG15]
MKMTRIFVPVLAPLALAVSSVASAGPSGYAPPPPPPKKQEFIVRVGASYFHPNTDRIAFLDETGFFFDGFRTTLDPDDEWGWNISGVWKATDHFSFELMYIDGTDMRGGSTDPFFDLVGLPDVRRRNLAEFDADASYAFANWYPLHPSCLIQPYVGVGLNYMDFSSEKFRGFVRRDLDDFGLDSDLNMGNSWGYAWQIGVDFAFGHDSAWIINAAAIYTDSETDVAFSVFDREPPLDPDDRFFEAYGADYNFNPWIFNLGVGYKFAF